MNVGELLDNLDTLTEEQRSKELRYFCTHMLSPVSQQELMTYQNAHQKTPDGYKDFVSGQNQLLRRLIKIELSEVLGDPVRAGMGMPPLRRHLVIPSGE